MPNMLIIDRIEEGFAVCEDTDRRKHEIPLEDLPKGVREGDTLRKSGEGYLLDPDEAARRRAHNKQLMRRLLSRGKPAEDKEPE